MNEGFKVLFDQYPELYSVTWQQYTPYFNDGEECRFRSGHTYPDLNQKDGEDLKYNSKESEAVKLFMASFDSDIMEFLFGDHVEVTVTREGIEVEDYEHE